METSAIEPTLVEVKPEYVDIYKSMTRVNFEVWDEADRRVYEGQVLSVTDNHVIITLPSRRQRGPHLRARPRSHDLLHH